MPTKSKTTKKASPAPAKPPKALDHQPPATARSIADTDVQDAIDPVRIIPPIALGNWQDTYSVEAPQHHPDAGAQYSIHLTSPATSARFQELTNTAALRVANEADFAEKAPVEIDHEAKSRALVQIAREVLLEALGDRLPTNAVS